MVFGDVVVANKTRIAAETPVQPKEKAVQEAPSPVEEKPKRSRGKKEE